MRKFRKILLYQDYESPLKKISLKALRIELLLYSSGMICLYSHADIHREIINFAPGSLCFFLLCCSKSLCP
ncbi:MAG TPA: hypothetical protein DCW95_02245 [Chryseobacterium sp.]|nr:hypothetical protein [Chryseobacterium sp.]